MGNRIIDPSNEFENGPAATGSPDAATLLDHSRPASRTVSSVGKCISHYELQRRIGAGGMGEVYLANDLALGRQAALKVLPPDFGPALRLRLIQEARTTARLQHPCIATFYEAGEPEGVAFIALEYVPGETLRERLRSGRLPVEQALPLVGGLLEALAHAHALGILH